MSDEDQRNRVRGQTRYVMRVVPNTGTNPNKKSEKLSTAVLGIPGLETPCGHNPMIPSLHPALAMVESGQRVYMSCTQCPPDSEMLQEVIRNATSPIEPVREQERPAGDAGNPPRTRTRGDVGLGAGEPKAPQRSRPGKRRDALAYLRGVNTSRRRDKRE